MKTLYTQRKKKRSLVILLVIFAIIIACGVYLITFFGSRNGKYALRALPERLTPSAFLLSEDDPQYPARISPRLESKYSIVYDNSADFVLYEKNANDKCYPASLTKLVTAILAIETYPDGHIFTIGNEVDLVGYNSSIAWLEKGQKVSLKGILSALLVTSGNDAAYVIATDVGRTLLDDIKATPQEAMERFSLAANEYLSSISALSSHFVNADGYHHEDHYTTARDLLLVTRQALKYDLIRELCSSYKSRVVFESGKDVTYTNSNNLINENSSFYSKYAVGMKTGTTSQAGNCLISVFVKDGREIICVNLNAPDSAGRYRDALAVANDVFK